MDNGLIHYGILNVQVLDQTGKVIARFHKKIKVVDLDLGEDGCI